MGFGKTGKYVDRCYLGGGNHLAWACGRISRAALAVLLSTPAVHAHPGGLDSRGGHHDRKSGGYHFHGRSGGGGESTSSHISVPQRLYRTEAREEPRQQARTLALSSARISPPQPAGFGSASTEESAVPEYDVKERSSSSAGELIKIAFRNEQPHASKQHLEAIALKEATVPYAVFYFLPGMALERPAWASCTHRRNSETRVHVFDDRVPRSTASKRGL